MQAPTPEVPRLLYARLDAARRAGRWHELGLPADADPAWFGRVQDRAPNHRARSETRAALLALVYRLARRCRGGVTRVDAETLRTVVRDEWAESGGGAQQGRRLVRAANAAWFHAHGLLPGPLGHQDVRPAGRPRPVAVVPDAPRGLTRDEVARLCAAADGLSPRHACLCRLLCTTGVRIGAVPTLRWGGIWVDGEVGSRAPVLEKGARPRLLPLEAGVRARLRALWSGPGEPPPDTPVFARPRTRWPITAAQLRHWWHQACDRAGLVGPHCHPHAARHYVAHELFNAGNPVAVIAKFLGHRSVETTNRHYLRLSFEELLGRLHLPANWLVPPA